MIRGLLAVVVGLALGACGPTVATVPRPGPTPSEDREPSAAAHCRIVALGWADDGRALSVDRCGVVRVHESPVGRSSSAWRALGEGLGRRLRFAALGGDLVAGVARDGRTFVIRRIDWMGGGRLVPLDPNAEAEPDWTVLAEGEHITALAVSPDGLTLGALISGPAGRRLRLVSGPGATASTAAKMREVALPQPADRLTWSPRGTQVVVDDGEALTRLDLGRGEQSGTWRSGDEDLISGVAFDSSGHRLLVALLSDHLDVLDAKALNLIARLEVEATFVAHTARGWVYACELDPTLYLLTTLEGDSKALGRCPAPEHEGRADTDEISLVSVSPRADLAAIACGSRTAVIELGASSKGH